MTMPQEYTSDRHGKLRLTLACWNYDDFLSVEQDLRRSPFTCPDILDGVSMLHVNPFNTATDPPGGCHAAGFYSGLCS